MMKTFQLSNGIPVLTELMPSLRSVSVGIWIRAGSFTENEDQNGLSHFMEHMAFKGTKTHTAREMAELADCTGGELNAYTDKLCTCYYMKVVDEYLPEALRLLGEMVVSPRLDPADFEKEKGVILEEIAMVEDSPEETIFDLLEEAAFRDSPLGRTVLGPAERIQAYRPEDLLFYREKMYVPGNIAVSVAGHFDENELRDLLERALSSLTGRGRTEYAPQRINEPARALFLDKNISQTHMALCYPGLPLGDKQVYDLAVLSNILGGGDSSRLFQKIREDAGLVYQIYTGPTSYPGTGEMTVYAACSPRNASRVLDMIDREMESIMRTGPDEKEFERARAQLKGSFVMGLESSYNRMNALGNHYTLLGRCLSPEVTLEGINAVTIESVSALAGQLFNLPRSAAFVGKRAEKLAASVSLQPR